MAFASARGAVRFGAVASAVLISGLTGGLTALPAQAAGGAGVAALVSAPQVTLLPQSSGVAAQRFHPVSLLLTAEDAPLKGVTVTVDASKAAGVTELSLPKGCAYTDATELRERCSVGAVDSMSQFTVGLRSAAGAALGAKGTVRFGVTAANGTLDKQNPPLTTDVTIGSGPDLAAVALPATLDVKSGQTSTVDPHVQNLGDQDANGVTLILDVSDPAAYPLGGGNWSNCRYGGSVAVVCHFDTVVKPGQAYGLSTPVALTPGAGAVDADMLMYGWDVNGGMLDNQVGGGKAGTGAPLTLVPVKPVAFARTQTDIDYDNNIGLSSLHLVTQDDLAVVAPHRITGTVGHTVAATFGVRNAGSAPTRPLDGTPNITAGLLVIVPTGVSVATLPKDCQLVTDGPGPSGTSGRLRGLIAHGGFGAHALVPSDAGDPPPALDGTPYACMVRQALKPGAQVDFTFSLKPAKALAQAPGLAIAIGQEDDNTPDNNIAEFTVTATKAAASASPTATHTPAPSASASSPTGGLAHTGGGSSALPLAAAGAGAIVLGFGAVLLTRRRRNGGSRA